MFPNFSRYSFNLRLSYFLRKNTKQNRGQPTTIAKAKQVVTTKLNILPLLLWSRQKTMLIKMLIVIIRQLSLQKSKMGPHIIFFINFFRSSFTLGQYKDNGIDAAIIKKNKIKIAIPIKKLLIFKITKWELYPSQSKLSANETSSSSFNALLIYGYKSMMLQVTKLSILLKNI